LKIFKNKIRTEQQKQKTMKKSILVIALAFGISSAFAQDLTSKKGEPILPESGDWAISMNADPIFTFVGNAFHGTAASGAPAVNWLNGNQTIIGKKFIDEKTAYRVLVRVGFNNQSYKNMLQADDQDLSTVYFPSQPSQVTDKYSHKETNIAIGVGKEMRRGKTRLQGFYGADAMIWLGMSGDKYTYGNTMTAVPTGNQTSSPLSTDWTNPTSPTTSAMTSRTTKVKNGMMFGLGVRGFIGCEYFIFPKIAQPSCGCILKTSS